MNTFYVSNLNIKWATKSIKTKIPVPAAKATCLPYGRMPRAKPIGPYILNWWDLIGISSWINKDNPYSLL